ncbi:MAG: response regulator transcription factor [Pseudomonadota bacterium]|nr:response regulator transcription factor [Pseudomonadota bacterium]
MQTSQAPQEVHEPPQSIWVIDDDAPVAQVLKFMLERQNYNVTVIADGRAASTKIENSTNPPTLILLSLMLPYLDGFELLGLIRAHDDWKSTPVIILTTKTAEQDIVRALDAGANDYVVKPFQPDELLARIRRYLREVL